MPDCGWFNVYFSFAFSVLRRFLPEEKVEAVKGLALTADGNGAVFDVPAEDLDMFLAGSVFMLPFFFLFFKCVTV